MKKIFLILFNYVAISSYSQQINIDKNVSILFPGKPNTSKEITKKIEAQVYYLNANDSFVGVRIEGIDKPFPLLKNEADLKEFYKMFSVDFIKKCNKKGLITKSTSFTKKGQYLVYKIEFVDEKSKIENGKGLVLFASGITYVFIYSKVENYSTERCKTFFSSININDNLSQIQSQLDYLSPIIKILLGIGVIVLLRLYRKRRGNQASS